MVPLPRTARSRGQPRLPDRAAAGPPRPAGPGPRRSGAVIDCDVHNVVGPIETLEPYLDDHWREVIATSQFAGPTDQAASAEPRDVAARRSGTGRRRRPRPTVATLRAHVLDPLGVQTGDSVAATTGSRASATPTPRPRSRPPSTTGSMAEWLDPEPRLRAAIVVAAQQPAVAIARDRAPAPDDPRFVAVYLPVRSADPVRQPDLVAAVGGDRATRARRRAALRRFAGHAADRLRLADLVAGGVRRHGVGVRSRS